MSDSAQNPERFAQIRDALFERGEMRVPELADALGVSLATMRRDLAALEEHGLIARSHGAARIAEAAGAEVAFARRETVNLAAKRAIAARALAEVAEGESVFFDAGTTVLQLAKYLRLQPRRLTVFTNGIAVASELAQVPDVSVNLIGGRLRPENLSLVGPQAVEALEQIWIDRLFLGASAISQSGRIASYDADEAHLNAKMTRRAAATYVLADHDKFGRHATFTVAALAAGMTLITDRAPGGALATTLSGAGCRVILAREGAP